MKKLFSWLQSCFLREKVSEEILDDQDGESVYSKVELSSDIQNLILFEDSVWSDSAFGYPIDFLKDIEKRLKDDVHLLDVGLPFRGNVYKGIDSLLQDFTNTKVIVITRSLFFSYGVSHIESNPSLLRKKYAKKKNIIFAERSDEYNFTKISKNFFKINTNQEELLTLLKNLGFLVD